MAHRRHPADFATAEANQVISRSDNHIAGASAPTLLGVLFMGNVTSPSRRTRMYGFVPDAEEAQHHRLPLHQESSVPSEYEGDLVHGYISDIELSQKELFDNIKDLVEKSVERIVKRRTNLRKKKKWIADNTKPAVEAIIIGQKSIPIDLKSFEHVLGIPAGQLPVETDEEAGKLGFLSLFGLSKVPTVRFFGDKIIKKKDLPDDEFCHCFMAVLLATLLCPNSSARPSTKYLGALIDVDEIRNRNWCKFAHVWMMWYIKKYQKERAKHNKSSITLGGCIYQLTVRYLDFIDFGLISLPSTIPRICVWKGKLIKHFSEMYKGRDGYYGNCSIRDYSETCYARHSTVRDQNVNDNVCLREMINNVIGQHMSDKLKNDIFQCFQSHMIDVDIENVSRAQSLLLDCLGMIINESINKPLSQTTEIVQTQSSKHEADDGQGFFFV
ncbi:hypothetical protein ACQ4PT_010969 [Festuca glaucescens]